MGEAPSCSSKAFELNAIQRVLVVIRASEMTDEGPPFDRIRPAQLLGKPVAECHALCVPTAQWGHPMCGPTSVRGFVAAEPGFQHLSGLGPRTPAPGDVLGSGLRTPGDQMAPKVPLGSHGAQVFSCQDL